MEMEMEYAFNDEAVSMMRHRFGGRWREAWVALKNPGKPLIVCRVRNVKPEDNTEETQLFCFEKLSKPTELEIMYMIYREGIEVMTMTRDEIEDFAKKINPLNQGTVTVVTSKT